MLTGVCYHQQSPQAIVLIWLRSFFRRLCKLLFLLFSSRGVNAETSDPRWCYLASDALTAETEVTVLLPFLSQLPCLLPLSCLDILSPQGFHCLRVVFFLLTLWAYSGAFPSISSSHWGLWNAMADSKAVPVWPSLILYHIEAFCHLSQQNGPIWRFLTGFKRWLRFLSLSV